MGCSADEEFGHEDELDTLAEDKVLVIVFRLSAMESNKSSLLLTWTIGT